MRRRSGLKREEVGTVHGMRILSHARGNPDPAVSRTLNDPVRLRYSTIRRTESIDVNSLLASD